MARFRFRAAVVLDLRQREEKDAATALAHAEARFREASEAMGAAEDRRSAAQRDLRELGQRGSDLGAILWHRNWIDRLAGAIDALRRERDERAAHVREAERVWRDARRRRLVIERMRDRALGRHLREAARRDQKAMDELARIRHVMPDLWRIES
jgi:flagellar export protein FliJ